VRERSPRLFDALLVTCEHGGNHVPAAHRDLFVDHLDVLASHRGYDPGALELARALAGYGAGSLVFSTTTRLLVDLNRPARSRSVHSQFTRPLSAKHRKQLLDEFHRPYWNDVFERVRVVAGRGQRLLHLSCHSFTPIWRGAVREVDIGLLYDPARGAEKQLGLEWGRALALQLPELRIRRNQPYHGSSPGLASSLRERWDETNYLGFEIELSQSFCADPVAARRRIHRALWAALGAATGAGER
jgi:predicted N-formylglutamate amidohydrolase